MDLKLCESDYRFMNVIWENEPLTSHELVEKCEKALGWKKSTTYTVLRKMCDKGFAQNENSHIKSLVEKRNVQEYASARFVENSFDGSLPSFLTAFLSGRKISDGEAEELKNLIDSYKED